MIRGQLDFGVFPTPYSQQCGAHPPSKPFRGSYWLGAAQGATTVMRNMRATVSIQGRYDEGPIDVGGLTVA
ncbi:hypothetical protein CEP54_007726 [Fusarium duplospermum]|uniref:Uncharacterized protein n=1 Tax=Fusarium duplospermum TaxID=1325734 RepID=A0A428PZN9_9HYPO|nr:hypothetical protein CEP54_007726 [Fusarium duplospermum]